MSSAMSLTSPRLFTNPASRVILYFTNTDLSTPPGNPDISFSFSSKPFINPLHFKSLSIKSPNSSHFEPFKARRSHIRVFEYEGPVQAEKLRISNRNLDTFLSIGELLCLASSAILSIGLAVNWAMSRWQKGFVGLLVDGIFAGQVVMLVCAVAIGAWIRRRQWRRICSNSSKTGVSEVNLIERVEKLEEDLRSSATIIRVLSRQLEKLGIRFRVTRKALKGPIAETAALAQKNSEATRALAVQEDILEKELGEIQKVLLAMQEQQQKQLELILAIGKAGKLWESRRGPSQEQGTIETYNLVEGVKEMEPHQTQPTARHKGTNNDKA